MFGFRVEKGWTQFDEGYHTILTNKTNKIFK